MALVPKPQIDQIKIKETTYDINVPKSWAQNDPAHVQYIKDRTHYQELLTGQDIQETAQYSFKNIYADSNQIYSDTWKPQQSWIYAGWPCAHENDTEHVKDITCSGGLYHLTFSAEVARGTKVDEITLFNGNAWINPHQVIDGKSNEIQIVANFAKFAELAPELANLIPSEWRNYQLRYNTTGYFYLANEPIAQENNETFSSGKNTLIIRPVTESLEQEGYRRYLYTHRLDAAFIPIDGKTLMLDSNGNLKAEDIYWNDFRVTEQFGRYEPLEWVPAEGRSVRDVINDAFCTDRLPSKVEPSIEFYVKTPEIHYEVGSTIDLDWAFRLKKGSYTYGLVNANKEVIVENVEGSAEKAYSNYRADSFEVTATSIALNITFNNFNFSGEFKDASGNPTDNCRNRDDAGTDYRTLKKNESSKQTTIILPPEPITSFKMALKIVGSLEDQYSAATMLGEISNPLVAIQSRELNYETSNILTSDYRWFWTTNSGIAPAAVTSEQVRSFNSQLSGFPAAITTNKMKSMCFFMPKARAKYTEATSTAPAILETSITVQNEATGASACLEMLNKEVIVKDIGGNEHEYLMYYFTNDAQDSGTNTYEIIINDLKEEGGNS